jgi:hypothetical protein
VLFAGATAGAVGVLVGTPALLIYGDRVGPPAVGARPADRADRLDSVILDSFETVGLAAGVTPIVYIIDGSWINVAGLGRRGGRPVLVTTSAVAHLARPDREVVAATGLSDALLGGIAVRVWPAARASLFLPFLLLYRLRFVLLLLWLGQLAAVAVVLDPVLMVVPLVIALGAWIPLGLSLGPILFAPLIVIVAGTRFSPAADVGAMSLLRHPEQWFEGMIVFSQWRWTRSTREGLRTIALDWLIPEQQAQFRRRTRRVQKALPAVGRRLGWEPFPELLTLDLFVGAYRHLQPRWRRADDLPPSRPEPVLRPDRRQR